jgi:pimeloyl-ACP methyl ester carboxylesterase
MTSAQAPTIGEKTVEVWNGQLSLRFQVAGTGSPIIYLHPAAGLGHWDGFLTTLAESHTVYCPEIPGTTPGDPHAIHKVDDLHDLVLIYEEAIRGLELDETPVLIGQSFGGMLASELTAHFPGIASRLVLLDPIGLWREDAPLADWMSTPPQQLGELLFADPTGPAAQAMFTMPDDPEMVVNIQAGLVWAMGCTGKFVWPIPERGLHKRLHRIDVPTLILWGRHDKLVPVSYADEFAKRIKGSRVEILENSGHIPQVEETEKTLGFVQEFLG